MNLAPPRDATPDRPPHLALSLSEPARGALQLGALPFAAPWLARAPRANQHGVLVLPGLLASDMSTAPLRGFLRLLGHDVRGWELGRNVGPTSEILEGMQRALQALVSVSGAAVSLIGWSMGGIYARELARDHPDAVRQVITLGSPFAMTSSQQTRADAAFRRRAHLFEVGQVPTREQVARPIPVPSTALYSRTDGIVAWQTCIDIASERHQNVEVRCAHLGFGADAATFWVIADRLAQTEPGTSPFRPPSALRFLYPGRP